jgi:hypothetical protein
LAGSHVVAAGFEAEDFEVAGLRAGGLAAWDVRGAADLAEAAARGATACFCDLSVFDWPLKTSDSQPALPASIGKTTNAAIATMMVRRRDQTPKLGRLNFLPDDSNSCFPRSEAPSALHDSAGS